MTKYWLIYYSIAISLLRFCANKYWNISLLDSGFWFGRILEEQTMKALGEDVFMCKSFCKIKSLSCKMKLISEEVALRKKENGWQPQKIDNLAVAMIVWDIRGVFVIRHSQTVGGI